MASRSTKKVIVNRVTKSKSKKESKSKPKIAKRETNKTSKGKSIKPQRKIVKSKRIQTNESDKQDNQPDKTNSNVSTHLTKKTVTFSKTLGNDSEWFITLVTKAYNYYKIKKLALITFRNFTSDLIKFIKNVNNDREQNESFQNVTKEIIINVIGKNYIIKLQKILRLVNVLIALGAFTNIDSSSKITKEYVLANYEPPIINKSSGDKKGNDLSTISNSISDIVDDEIDICGDNSRSSDYDLNEDNTDDNSSDCIDADFSNVVPDESNDTTDVADHDISNDIDDNLDNDDDINIVFGDTNKVRDYFIEDEITKIINEGQKDVKNNLIICLLLYNGFRMGGLINIKMENIYDYQNNKLKYDGKTLERKNKFRYFSILRNEKLVNAFNEYFETYPDILENRGYLFPRGNNYEKQTSVWSVQKIIKMICKKCKIRNNLAHVHAFRKTVVVRLMKEENNLDKVALFIGHSSASTIFKHYWNPSGEDMLKDINIPWITKPKIGIQLSDIKKIDTHVRSVAKTETSETDINEEYLQFIKKVYWPLKKDASILEERFKIVKMLLSEKSKKLLDEKVKEIKNTINDAYKEAEKENDWDKFTNTNNSQSDKTKHI